MPTHELYLPMLLPLWGIFIGFSLVIIGFVDKKAIYTYVGWSVLIATSLVSLYYNLFQIHLPDYSGNLPLQETARYLVTAGWLNVAGACLAATDLFFFYHKKKRYLLLASLTLLFFAIQFFQYYSLIQKPK